MGGSGHEFGFCVLFQFMDRGRAGFQKAWRNASLPLWPTTEARKAAASMEESGTPALKLRSVPGTQVVPPDVAVVPPTCPVFSHSRTSSPSSEATSAAVIPPAPPPKTSRSTSSGCDMGGIGMGFLWLFWRLAAM
jgi:hypothetical protein